MNLFSKLKDYNNLLENILDRKTFSSSAKSLLLSMIYKIEVAYLDREKVKKKSLSKDEFLTHILEMVKNYCDHVKIVEPDSEEATLLAKHQVQAVTNHKERSILAYPTEIAMLYAISDIEPKYYFMKEDFIFKKVFQNLLVEAYKQNTMEVLKNFNGWSWDVDVSQQIDYVSNLIYQNIMIVKGEKFLQDWRMDASAKTDYLLELKRTIRKITGNDNYYVALCKVLYLVADKVNKTQIQKQLQEKEKEYLQVLAKENTKEDKELKVLKNYHSILYNTNSVLQELLNLQIYFLIYLKKKIEKTTIPEEMMEIIYQIRYYQNIEFSENCLIKNYDALKKELDYVWKLAITKACKMNVIKIISMDIETNFEFVKYALDTRMIDLEEVRLYLEFEKEDLILKIYDKEVFEKQTKMDRK